MKILIAALLAFSFAQSGIASAAGKNQLVDLQVTEKGFEPMSIDVKPGTTVTLKVTRTTDSTCTTSIKIPAKKITKELPLNKAVSINLGKLEKGEIRFACGMDMLGGKILVQ